MGNIRASLGWRGGDVWRYNSSPWGPFRPIPFRSMWRSNPALAGALLLLLLLLSPAAEAKRVPRRRPRPQAQQPDAPGAGTDDFNYEEGYDEYPDYYEELEFVYFFLVPLEKEVLQNKHLHKYNDNHNYHNPTTTAATTNRGTTYWPGRSRHFIHILLESFPYKKHLMALNQLKAEAKPQAHIFQEQWRLLPLLILTVDVPETTLPPEPVEPSPQPPSRAVSPPQPDSRVGPDRKEPFSCTFEGRQYANLEEWEPDACTSCQCLRGQVECSQQQPCSSGRDTEFAT
uniref:VWFC domain-containing protein n=1 Tax=Timema shepardi TaxID=629360 RepID=A0A7R9FZM7_TIMSH|nr:unnamed protein product [Timema shepardi]